MARSCCNGIAISQVLPLLWMTSCLHNIIMHGIGQNQTRRECFVQFVRWRHRERSVPSLTAPCFACTITAWNSNSHFSAILIIRAPTAQQRWPPALYSISSDDLQLPLPEDADVTPAHNNVNSVATNSVIVRSHASRLYVIRKSPFVSCCGLEVSAFTWQDRVQQSLGCVGVVHRDCKGRSHRRTEPN